MGKKHKKKPTVDSKDRGQLSIQIDICADKLSELIGVVRKQKNEALVRGDLVEADRLDDLSLDLTDQYAVLIRHQLQQIDNSTLMRKTIRGFAGVNGKIDSAIKEIKELTAFANAVASIAAILDKLITSSLVKI